MAEATKQLQTTEEQPSSGVSELVESPHEENVGTGSCVSKGNHHEIKVRRDKDFQGFMTNLTDLWRLQYQGQSSVDDGSNTDEDEEAKLQAAKDYLERALGENTRFQDEYSKYKFHTEDCFMYRDFWIPQKMPQTGKLNFKDKKVRFDGANRSFNEATVGYIDRIFGNEGVFRVPSFLVFRDGAKLRNGKAKNDLTLHSDQELHELGNEKILDKEQIDTLLGERNAGKAVDKVVETLERWAVGENDNMFIFTEYEYNNYLKNVKSIQVMDKVSGNYKVMAISEKNGVFFIQSKGCKPGEDDNTIQKKAKEAFVRTMKDKFFFLQCNRDLSHITSKLPVYSFVALPNLTDDDVQRQNLCQHHKSVILTGSSLETVDRFADWIKDATRSMRSLKDPVAPAITHERFKELCGRYAGPASKLVPVSTAAAILAAGKKLQLNFLTPEQKKVCDNDRKFVIISGDTCTGKSLILASKAKQIVKRAKENNTPCNVNIILGTDINESMFCPLDVMSDRPTKQMKKLVKNEEGITICQCSELQQVTSRRDDDDPRFKFDVTPEMFVQTIIQMTAERDGVKQHLLVDEVPFDLLKRSKDQIEEALNEIPGESHVWLCVSTFSYRVKSLENQDPRWIRDFMPSKFHFVYLDLFKRVPMSLSNVMKEIQRFTGDGHGEFSKCGHMVFGPKPLLYCFDECGCSTTADMDYTSCPCIEGRMFATFERVFENLEKSGIENKDVAIMLHNIAFSGTTFANLQQLLNNTFNRLNIELVWSTVLCPSSEREEHHEGTPITVVDVRTFGDCEAKVLIGVDQCGMFNHFAGKREVGWHKMPMMRCIAQYILVTWPEKEAAQNWRKYISEYEMDVEARDDLTQEQIAFQNNLIQQSKDASNKPSCLEKLLRKNLFKL